MLDQEKAFHQIQDAKVMVEDDLSRKLEEFEEEREHLQKMANSASALERELEEVRRHSCVKVVTSFWRKVCLLNKQRQG